MPKIGDRGKNARKRIAIATEKWAGENWHGEGYLLPIMLSAAVPLWMHQFSRMTEDERDVEFDKLNEGVNECSRCEGNGKESFGKKNERECTSCKGTGFIELEFCLQMEFVLRKGPKEGDTAKAFNNLAKAIALLSFVPGGIHIFGAHYQWK